MDGESVELAYINFRRFILIWKRGLFLLSYFRHGAGAGTRTRVSLVLWMILVMNHRELNSGPPRT